MPDCFWPILIFIWPEGPEPIKCYSKLGVTNNIFKFRYGMEEILRCQSIEIPSSYIQELRNM